MSDFAYYSSVKSRDVQWLWYPYIPYGKITVLQGDPGEGKSTLILNLMALLTKGGTLPDGTIIDSPQNVIYQCAEDSKEDTIKPRMERAGADCSRVAFIEDSEKGLTLDDKRIEETIYKVGARLLVLDPIQSFLPADTDMQSAARMRGVLSRLAAVADKTSCAIVLVGHMTKASGGKNLYRGLGSIDIAAVARSILMVERDSEFPDIRYMFPVKSSLAPEGKSIAFVLDADKGFQWMGRCTHRGAEVKEEDRTLGKREKAKQLLKILLSDGSVPSNEIFSRMEAVGISHRTVQTAGKEVGIKSYKMGTAWYWSMEEEAEMDNGNEKI